MEKSPLWQMTWTILLSKSTPIQSLTLLRGFVDIFKLSVVLLSVRASSHGRYRGYLQTSCETTGIA